MFLATTALNQFWDTDQDIFFLSSGCLRYDERTSWESLKYEVMPSPWNDRERFYNAAGYLDKCYERMLDRLSKYLNSALGVSHEPRYWRILVGPWLFHYLHVVYDRYTLLSDAFVEHPGLQTYTLDPQCFFTPKDLREFTDLVCYDAYNLQIFSQLLQRIHGTFPTRMLENTVGPNAVEHRPLKSKVWSAMKSVARFGLRFGEGGISRGLERFALIQLCDMNIPRTQAWTLARRTGMSAIPSSIKNDWPFAIPGPILNHERNDLEQLEADDDFEAAFVQTLPQNFPSIYLEGFHLAQAETAKKRSRTPSVLVTVTGWYFNEPFKFLAAEGSEKGCRLVAVQHGGMYGVVRWIPAELHEFDISDAYMLWGWAGEGVRSQHNLPSPKLSKVLATQRRDSGRQSKGSVLVVTTAHPRFLLRFQSNPVGDQWNDYFKWMDRFLGVIPDEIRQEMLLRPGEKDYGWDIRSRTSDAFPDVRWDDAVNYYRSLKISRMVVSDYPGTAYLEAMTANVPTVLFWNPERFEMRDDAEPYFDGLRQAGILWDSPEEAATHTASIFENPSEWWESQPVQKAATGFLDRYALGRKDWTKRWADVLREEVALSRIIVAEGAIS